MTLNMEKIFSNLSGPRGRLWLLSLRNRRSTLSVHHHTQVWPANFSPRFLNTSLFNFLYISNAEFLFSSLDTIRNIMAYFPMHKLFVRIGSHLFRFICYCQPCHFKALKMSSLPFWPIVRKIRGFINKISSSNIMEWLDIWPFQASLYW